jgi:hypothetical protein
MVCNIGKPCTRRRRIDQTPNAHRSVSGVGAIVRHILSAKIAPGVYNILPSRSSRAAGIGEVTGRSGRSSKWGNSLPTARRMFLLIGLVGLAHEMGAARVVGEYQPTTKNGVVADLWTRLGFTPEEDGALFARPVNSGEDGPDVSNLETSILPV